MNRFYEMKHFFILSVCVAMLGCGLNSNDEYSLPMRADEKDGTIFDYKKYEYTKQDFLDRYPNLPELYEKYTHTALYEITYFSDGLKVKGILAIPKGKQETYPCIIYNRGGNKSFGALNPFGLIKYCNWGYIVVGSQYRGNEGGEGKEEFGGADINDVLNLIPLLEQIPKADTSRIGMYGASRGAMMTYLALTHTNKIRAAVAKGSMTNLQRWIELRPDVELLVCIKLIPKYLLNIEDALKQRSAVHFYKEMNRDTPILMLHGSSDWRASCLDSLELSEKLYSVAHPHKLIIYEGADHSISEFRDEENYETRLWFDRYVKNKEELPNMKLHGP